MKDKYINKIYDGMWKVIRKYRKNRQAYFILENIYNHRSCEVCSTTLRSINEGKTTVSNVISSRIKRSERTLVY